MALCPQNGLVSQKKLWRPRFASMPHVRAVYVQRGRRLRAHKINGRHFFLMLRVGRSWQKYFALPPLPKVRGFADWLWHADVPAMTSVYGHCHPAFVRL